jgi:hypothetical protein
MPLLFACVSWGCGFYKCQGQRFSGRAEIAIHHAIIFTIRFKNSYLKITQSKVRFIKRFMLSELDKVSIETGLLALIHNLRKKVA